MYRAPSSLSTGVLKLIADVSQITSPLVIKVRLPIVDIHASILAHRDPSISTSLIQLIHV